MVSLNDAELPGGQGYEGATTDNEIDLATEIKALALLSVAEYDKARTGKAKQLGVRVSTLDAEVKAARSVIADTADAPFDQVSPHPEKINPKELLDEIADTIKRFIILSDDQANMVALWAAMTWFVDAITIAPLLIISAPGKSCGKSQLLTLLSRIGYRPLSTDNASPSAIFRSVEMWRPTLFIDEADTFFKDNRELHGLVNSGYARNGYVLRSEEVGGAFKVKRYATYSAKAIAGVALEKHLPDTTMSRGVVVNLRKKLKTEKVERLRHAEIGLFSGIASKLARFNQDYSAKVRDSRPPLPEALNDREQDNVDALLAIAGCAGEDWINAINKAALALSGNEKSTQTIDVELMGDIKAIFDATTDTFITTAGLIEKLCEDDDAPWQNYNKGRPIGGRQIAGLLKPYGIEPDQQRLATVKNPKRGYNLEDFEDAFSRYLPEPKESETETERF